MRKTNFNGRWTSFFTSYLSEEKTREATKKKRLNYVDCGISSSCKMCNHPGEWVGLAVYTSSLESNQTNELRLGISNNVSTIPAGISKQLNNRRGITCICFLSNPCQSRCIYRIKKAGEYRLIKSQFNQSLCTRP